MAERVLSTEAACSAIQRMQVMLSSEFRAQVNQLDQQGNVTWGDLDRAVAALDEMRTRRRGCTRTSWSRVVAADPPAGARLR
jgi:hypothetical protein